MEPSHFFSYFPSPKTSARPRYQRVPRNRPPGFPSLPILHISRLCPQVRPIAPIPSPQISRSHLLLHRRHHSSQGRYLLLHRKRLERVLARPRRRTRPEHCRLTSLPRQQSRQRARLSGFSSEAPERQRIHHDNDQSDMGDRTASRCAGIAGQAQ